MNLRFNLLIKVMTVIISSLAYSVYLSWISYTPPDERAAEVLYHSFMTLFAFLFPPAFFLFFIFGAILSSWVDHRLSYYTKWAGMKKAMIVITAYAGIGLVGGLALSLLSQAVFLSLTIPGALLFLVVQTLLQYSFSALSLSQSARRN
ncbi:hypothetical protein M3202_05135 [Alkalihalobacillus oceani]|uniref:Uncharacterized protein n=1 Tax=Halalkalibacter oceani TaxID=1653776 RepID=A0A9X2DQU8_9BACI|nr:hypothetical protein [Halalkalibacter oceani]MCM3713458.1 hypothetical protein [Halalkalibacter oceani]